MRRNGPSALALPTSALVLTMWIAVACGLAGSPKASTPAVTAPARNSAGTTFQASLVPTGLPLPGQATQAASSVTTSVSVNPSPGAATPPSGFLSAGEGSIVGLIGAYCWNANGISTCVDSVAFTDRQPDLPSMAAGVGSQLHFSLDGEYPFATWSASYVDDNGNVVPLGGAGKSFDPDATQPSLAPLTDATFPAPPVIDQSVVQLFVRFAEGGDASYGWSVTVQ